ncbi:hypothetical protein P9Y62_30750 [Bacillus thuringiensis]|uniref:Uncharacterized protein n=1 Tax=Bacillus thuringiensis HD-771 TaxID=1218175 RepID=A0A9W3JHB5_BACTU|nr:MULTISPECIES: hypothetical protein [Bacillus cereus group]AFQ19962.1 hypothetical protein BTG_33153 [Bacillus thuringiensis HD-771]MEB4894331.1 hypothetical protein [Bacillus thuringiensis]MEC2562895.1 hypothetical protein [Bacillus thuringiensis]MEC2645519.1 hypothetical protein [Bacillus thuringiensis]MEC2726633.1 hypothetical protein [Bacillus thuringiensis]
MNQINVVFKRRAVTATVEIRHNNFYVEFNHLTGYLYICKFERGISYSRSNEVKIYKGYIKYSADSPFGAIPTIEEMLKKCDLGTIRIARNYVEAYYVGHNEQLEHLYPIIKNDLSVYKGVFVDGLTVREVIEQTDFDMLKDFKMFKVERVWDAIEPHLMKIEEMFFTEIYTFFKGNFFKVNYRDICTKFFS